MRLAVHPDFRRQGNARALMMAALLQLKRCHRVALQVAQDRTAAIALYESLDFVRIRELPDYYGEGKHAWFMVREG